MLGVPFLEYLTCDKKVASQKWLGLNGHSQHHFKDLDMLMGDVAECMWHKSKCGTAPAEGPADLVICGPPCTPWSAQRSTRGTTRCLAAHFCVASLRVSCSAAPVNK